MSLKPQTISPVLEETARVARAAYPKGNVYMHMRNELGTIYEDESFAHLFPNNGQPAEARLSLSAGHNYPVGPRTLRPASRRCGAGSH
jgi:transposase